MNDAFWMKKALQEAKKARHKALPNPSVGALVVRDGVCYGKGHTQAPYQPHAEVMALREAGPHARGATLYVTLEPCNHIGKTQACTNVILESGIARVVVGSIDPNPLMQGKSISMLRERGIQVQAGVLQEACDAQIYGFKKVLETGIPEITLKVAMSLNGALSTVTGESKWITHERMRRYTRRLRGEHHAIVVGIETILADNPALTVRVPGGEDPVPVILDTHARIPKDAAVFSSSKRPILCCATPPQESIPADIWVMPVDAQGKLSLEPILRTLAERGLQRVWVEGGAQVHRSFLDSGQVDTLHLCLGDVIIPGGKNWVGGTPVIHLSEATSWKKPQVKRIADQLFLTYRR